MTWHFRSGIHRAAAAAMLYAVTSASYKQHLRALAANEVLSAHSTISELVSVDGGVAVLSAGASDSRRKSTTEDSPRRSHGGRVIAGPDS